MIDTVVRALTLVLVVVIAQLFKRAGWATTSDFTLLGRMMMYVTLPAALATSFNEFEITTQLLWLAVIGVGVNLVLQGAGYLMERPRSRQAQAFAILNTGSFNVGAFATPYIAMFAGSSAIVYSSIFDVGGAFAAAGVAYVWAVSRSREGRRTSPGEVVRLLASSPVFVTYMVLLALRLSGVVLPEPVIVVTSTIGAANPFVAMFMVGVGLELRLDRAKYGAVARFLALRYAIVAIAAVACWFLLPFPAEVRAVLVVVLAAPVASMMAVFTADVGGDVELSTFITSVTVLVAIVAMPVLYLLLG